MLPQATQPQILKSNQKEDEYINKTQELILGSLDILIPQYITYRSVTNYKQEIKLVSKCLYYLMTTFTNRRTLGQQYANIVPFNQQDFDMDGLLIKKSRKITFLILMCLVKYGLNKYLKKRFNSLREKSQFQFQSHIGLKWSIMRCLPQFDGILEKIFKIQFCLFCIDGKNLQLAKRLTNIDYQFTQKPQEHNIHYYKIGYIIAIHLLGEFVKFSYKVYQDYSNSMQIKQEEERDRADNLQAEFIQKSLNPNAGGQQQAQVKPENMCGLCFDQRQFTTITPCGHLFCWECIIQCCQIKPECPSCRQPCKPQNVVQLRNYC